jgi:DnaA-like protein
MLDYARLGAIECHTALEVELLAALVHERRLRQRLEQPPQKPIPQVIPEEDMIRAGVATVRQIQDAVAKAFCLTTAELRANRRHHRPVMARHLAVMLCHALTLHSYPELGRMFGDKDHSTMINSVRRMQWVLRDLVKELTAENTLGEWVRTAYAKLMVDTSPSVADKLPLELPQNTDSVT